MQTRYVFLLAAFAAAIAAIGWDDVHGQDRKASGPQPRPDAPSGGMLGILPHGVWECALPGDAGGAAFLPVPEEGFSIGPASSYESPAGRGIYLLRGTEMVFTRGPKKDERFRVLGANTVQKLQADGQASRLICTRVGGGT